MRNYHPLLSGAVLASGAALSLRTNSDIATCTRTRMVICAISTTLRSPNLNTNNLAVNPSQTVANRPVIVTANVVNEGGMTGSTRVALKINGQVEQTKLVTVGPGGSRPVKFTVTKKQPGNYTVIMGSQRASFLVTDDSSSGISVDGSSIMTIVLPHVPSGRESKAIGG